MRLNSFHCHFQIHVDITSNELTSQQSDVDAFGQEWFDEDFGLSRTRKEAEALRLQQLQIEQEVSLSYTGQRALNFLHFQAFIRSQLYAPFILMIF